MSGGKDRQTLFHRILPAIARGLTLTTPIDCHLKVKDKKSNIGLIKIYCITVSMQKISPIHKLIQQILGSHELNDHAHFRPGPTFTFLKFAPTCQKSVHCINSFLRYSQFQSPVTRLAIPISDQTHLKFFDQLLICEFVSTCKKSGYFINLFWRYG